MQINVRTHHVDITQSLKEYALKKMEKLEKYFENIQEILLELNILSTADENKSQEVLVTAWLKGNVIRAKEVSKDMYATIDMVYDKLEKQLVKHKERIKSHKKEKPNRIFLDMEIESKPTGKEVGSKKDKHYIAKPCVMEDAIQELEANHLSFIVFRNAETKVINVLYVNEDNNYNLIES
ncbi:MAG: ribosome-associated translation inhibitor RaiA [Candidatus Margulisiibacteriota bacterium]